MTDKNNGRNLMFVCKIVKQKLDKKNRIFHNLAKNGRQGQTYSMASSSGHTKIKQYLKANNIRQRQNISFFRQLNRLNLNIAHMIPFLFR